MSSEIDFFQTRAHHASTRCQKTQGPSLGKKTCLQCVRPDCSKVQRDFTEGLAECPQVSQGLAPWFCSC